jgi:putative DNA primase/helicase
MDFTSKFITFIVNSGIIPKDINIIPTNRFRRIASETDRGGKRSISYWLRIEKEFAYGYAKDFKTGIEARFNSVIDEENITRADLAAIKTIIKQRQLEQDRQIAERHVKIAQRAKQKWALCKKSGGTLYNEAKHIQLHSAGIYGQRLLWIPVYELQKDGELDLVSWQTIEEDGVKKFPFGGKKNGCFAIIGQINPTKNIIICEGWATGCSIKEATGTDCVVVALDAGNLLPVAKNLRKIYKFAPIVVAADNDESQTGQKAAAKIVKNVTNSTSIICPIIGADFNDLPSEATKKAFGVQEGGDQNPVLDSLSDKGNLVPVAWASKLILDSKERIVGTSLANIILHLMYHEDFKDTFYFDEFKQAVLIKQCPIWTEEEKFKVGSLSDIHITQCAATLEAYGLTPTIEKVAKAIGVVADENKFHSAREYLNTLKWDKTPRLERFLIEDLGCKEEDQRYLSFIFKKWMCAAVTRIFNPGCKFDHMLVFESQQQGLYKSALLKCLATFNGERYHTDAVNIGALGDKDTILKLQGNIIIELAELDGFSAKDDNAVKNWLTQEIDEVRLPYNREVSKFPRQFVFAATTNNSYYLKDPTGNRRYWPLTIDKIIDIQKIDEIKGQLWAEAVQLYKDGIYIGPTPEENLLADYERKKRLASDAWEDMVLSAIDKIGLDEFKIDQVMEKLDLRLTEKNEKTMKRVATILKMNNYQSRVVWHQKYKKSMRLWCREDAQ